MKVGITFNGLDDLLKACEECASEAELAHTNRKIVERSTVILKKAMKERIRRAQTTANPAAPAYGQADTRGTISRSARSRSRA